MVGCIALTFIFIAPLISVFPGSLVETIAAQTVDNSPYSNVGKLTIELLTTVFFGILILSLLNIRKTAENTGQVSRRRIIGIMLLLYFPIHSLGFYIYWGLTMDFQGDGQLIMASLITYPISGLFFVPIGLLIDWVKNKYTLKPLISTDQQKPGL
jgi:hypothetical protein